ncbi:MAG: DAK2 domain-containing protein, partial [Lachnospiraceae bacterium]|nr:DAK2 domain-containing protein [Lachnospiraceae bacterium]
KGISDKAECLVDDGVDDMETFLSTLIEHAEYVLSQTPEMLPVLKQAGVVDSGGQGLVEVLRGAFDAYLGKELDLSISDTTVKAGAASDEREADIRFGYDTKFIIVLSKSFNIKNEMDFKAYLESIGDSAECTTDDGMVKVQLHTNDPGLALQKGLKYGQLSDISIQNIRLGSKQKSEGEACDTAKTAGLLDVSAKEELSLSGEPRKQYGFIAVSAGDGVNEIFRSLGVDYIIEGGQTMNPSTADILDAVDKVNADTIFVLPNNKNIVLAANQAAELMTEKNLLVIPTKTIPQGITAVINFVPELTADENETFMLREIGNVKTGQVTYAVRDTVIDDISIQKDDFMGIGDSGILSAGSSMDAVTDEMLEMMVDETSELISIYYGADVTEAAASAAKNRIAGKFPNCDIELQYGGQPIYYYIISVE